MSLNASPGFSSSRQRWHLIGWALTLTLVLLPTAAQAQSALSASPEPCSEAWIDDVLQRAYPGLHEAGDGGGRLLHDGSRLIRLGLLQCRVWPARPEATLLAIPLKRMAVPDETAADDIDRVDLELLLVGTADRVVQLRRYEPGRLSSDAIRVDGLRLDTARYQLRPDRLAFGLRVTRKNSSRGNPFNEETLSLYLPDAHGLQPVLGNLEVASFGGEWDTQCTGDLSESTATVATAEPDASGWAVLAVDRRTVDRRFEANNDDCDETSEQSRDRVRLQFDGRTYPVPADWSGLDDDYSTN